MCLDTTGFAEAVSLTDVVTLATGWAVFEIIDPISVNCQGNDRGSEKVFGIYVDEGPHIETTRSASTGAAGKAYEVASGF